MSSLFLPGPPEISEKAMSQGQLQKGWCLFLQECLWKCIYTPNKKDTGCIITYLYYNLYKQTK
jgi:hypothetical protein